MGTAVTQEAKPGRAGVTQAALSALERYGGRRGQQLLAFAAGAQLAYPAAKWLWERAHRETSFTVTVFGEDGVYGDLHEWVLERVPADDRRALILATQVGKITEDSPVRLYYDGATTQSLMLDDHKVWVRVEKEEDLIGSLSDHRRYTQKIIFTATTPAGRDAIIRMIDGLAAAKRVDARPPLMVPARWGGEWNRRGDLPERTLESVILKEGQLERLVDDLGEFLNSEERYGRLYQPWHRGYLFHGIPGTGKTSVARALANHFKMSIYYLPLGDLDADADLMRLVTQVEPRSMLLLEDVDTNHAATNREDTKGRTSVAALLNALDGIWTPHGLVTVMTTNNREKLDDALVREGRIDVDEEFTALDESQAQRLADWFDAYIEPERAIGESPASLIEELRNTHETRREVAV